MQANQQDTTLSCIQHSLEDAQATIKAYDVKAEVLGLLLTLAVGITNFGFLRADDVWSKVFMYLSCILGLVALFVLGFVLVPQIKKFQQINFDGYVPSEAYFLSKVLESPQNTVPAIAKKMLSTDWVSELTYELMKLSIIREYKHKWFVRGLLWSAAAIACVLAFVCRSVYLWR
jgi:hypothetical protein